jgi:hypothetical protein
VKQFTKLNFSGNFQKLTISHNKLKSRLFQIIDNGLFCFVFLTKNGTKEYKCLVIGKQDTYFVRHHSDSPHKYSEADIKSMLGFLVNNIFVVFGNQVFEQSVGIPMGTNCAPLLADLFLYSYEAEFVLKKQNILPYPSTIPTDMSMMSY